MAIHRSYERLARQLTYMIILFILFLLQFSLACACLAVNGEQKNSLARQGWAMSGSMTRINVQHQFDCCGFEDPNLNDEAKMGHPPCADTSHCCSLNKDAPCCSGIYPNTTDVSEASKCPCDTCFSKLQTVIYDAFSLTGGLGLFFSFTEIIGVWITVKYRNQKDPSANPGAFL